MIRNPQFQSGRNSALVCRAGFSCSCDFYQEVRQGNQPVLLELPPAKDLYDDNYGHTQVYYQQLKFQIPTQANQSYQVSWQGCAQSIQFKTDLSGLVQFEAAGPGSKRLLASAYLI